MSFTSASSTDQSRFVLLLAGSWLRTRLPRRVIAVSRRPRAKGRTSPRLDATPPRDADAPNCHDGHRQNLGRAPRRRGVTASATSGWGRALRTALRHSSAWSVGLPRQSDTSEAAYLSSLNSLCCNEPKLFATARIPLRVPGAHGNIRTLETFVTYVGESTFEIRLDDHVIGFIQRADRAFAARAGPRMKETHVCPQRLLWDEAARALVHAAGL